MSLTGGTPTGSGNATIDTSGGNIDLTGSLSGSGGLTKAGSGTLILGGSNSYLGETIVEEGKLIVEIPAGLADGSNLAVGAGVSSFSVPLTGRRAGAGAGNACRVCGGRFVPRVLSKATLRTIREASGSFQEIE